MFGIISQINTEMDKLTQFPKEGHCLIKDDDLVNYLCNRPYARPDMDGISKTEVIGIAWNETSHWWIKTKNNSKPLFNIEQLQHFWGKETPKYEIGKWYTHKKWSPNSYIKFKSIRDSNTVWEIDRISQGDYKGTNDNWSISYEHTLEEAKMDVVSQFLPDGHEDKLFLTQGEYYEITYSDNSKLKYVVVGNGNLRTLDCLNTNSNSFCKTNGFSSQNIIIKKATQDDVDWLDKCIKENNFVPKPENKSFNKEEWYLCDGNFTIYKDGKWAEIVEEKKYKHEVVHLEKPILKFNIPKKELKKETILKIKFHKTKILKIN